MRITFPRIACLVTLAASLLQCGCSTVNTVEPAEPVAQRQMLSDKRIITDTGLYGRVRIVGINTATVSTGFLKIQVEVQNLSSSLQAFAYHLEWFDANGMVVNTPTSAWIDRQIQGGETLSLTAVAPTETAKDFRIKFVAR
ncbi:MAG TPA: YcfL family protein [Verrucomicrobiae bacterium]|nr:YcfL family protein [Verrucomicrobiae bacterium]